METSEYERYAEIAKEKREFKSTALRKSVDKWQLVHKCNNDKIIHGNYALCRNEQNKREKGTTKIIPYTFKI